MIYKMGLVTVPWNPHSVNSRGCTMFPISSWMIWRRCPGRIVWPFRTCVHGEWVTTCRSSIPTRTSLPTGDHLPGPRWLICSYPLDRTIRLDWPLTSPKLTCISRETGWSLESSGDKNNDIFIWRSRSCLGWWGIWCLWIVIGCCPWPPWKMYRSKLGSTPTLSSPHTNGCDEKGGSSTSSVWMSSW